MKRLFLALIVLFTLCLSACSSTGSSLVSEKASIESTNLVTPIKVSEIDLYSVYYFAYGDDECYVVIDEDSSRADSSSLQCNFGQALTQTDNPTNLASVGLYSIYYLQRGDDECYIVLDEGSSTADSSAMRCSL